MLANFSYRLTIVDNLKPFLCRHVSLIDSLFMELVTKIKDTTNSITLSSRVAELLIILLWRLESEPQRDATPAFASNFTQ
jgi:hypothetical protein